MIHRLSTVAPAPTFSPPQTLQRPELARHHESGKKVSAELSVGCGRDSLRKGGGKQFTPQRLSAAFCAPDDQDYMYADHAQARPRGS